MDEQSSEAVVQHTLNLGKHTLVLWEDGSIDVCQNAPSVLLKERSLRLDREETYRLFVSLQTYFHAQE